MPLPWPCEAEEGWLLQQAVDIRVWAFGDQFNWEMVRAGWIASTPFERTGILEIVL